jgi:hypothetical protein
MDGIRATVESYYMKPLIQIMYKEIAEARGVHSSELPTLKELISDTPQDHEAEIAIYLEKSPNYSALGKVVRDALDPACTIPLYPGTNTDGLYLWPLELAHYVRKYHVRLPEQFLERMKSLDWNPPPKTAINFKNLYAGLAT